MTHLMIHDGENNGIFYSVDDTIYFITHRYVGMYLLLIYVYIWNYTRYCISIKRPWELRSVGFPYDVGKTINQILLFYFTIDEIFFK